ncbi:MAG TPA: hypothetical protein VIM31_01700 [Candidatus Microsaccharimonas sp.]|jgi:hypothetical protein
MTYSEINLETIRLAVKPLSKEEYDIADMHLRHGKHLSDDFVEELARIPDSVGDGVASFTPNYGIVRYELRGAVRKLAAQTLVRSESFVVPEVIKPQHTEYLMYGQPVDKEFYGALTMTEPKRPRGNIQKVTRFFVRRSPAFLVPEIDDGLDSFLNGGLIAPAGEEAFKLKLQETQLQIATIHRMEQDTVQTFIDSFKTDEQIL